MTKVFNYAKCIRPLLEVLNWQGAIRHIYEAIPHLTDNLSILDLRNMMANLGYFSTHKALVLSHHSEAFYPCLFVTPQEIYILLKREEGMVHAIDCRTQKKIALPERVPLKGTAYAFSQQPEYTPTKGRLYHILCRFRVFFYRLMGLSLLNSLLNASVFLFVMFICNTIVPAQAGMTLEYIILGLGLILGCIQFIQNIQGHSLSYLNARLDMIIGTEVIRQIMGLSLSLAEEMSLAVQVSRLRELNKIRHVVIEPLIYILLELPSLIVYIIALYWIGGPLIFILLGMLLVLSGLSILLFPILQYAAQQLSTTSFEQRKFILESTSHLATLKHLGIERTWVDRFQKVSTSTSIAQKRVDILFSFITNLSQIIMKISTLALIMWGAARVMEETMTVASLIAVILLVWRIHFPLQKVVMSLGKFFQVIDHLKKFSRFMSMPTEHHIPLITLPSFEGEICAQNVGFHYPNTKDFTLQGITMEAKPGEIIAIVGANGSGKTTFLKLLLGFYAPQAGSITFNGVDSQQFAPLTLKQSIAYVPQRAQFFQGTLAQNFRLAKPDATDKEIMEAIEKAGLLDQILTLPEGLQTCIGNQSMPLFSFGFLQRLNLARAYVCQSKIIIMDEPSSALDPKGEQLLHQTIKEFCNRKITLLVTHHPSLVTLADRILFLHNGTMQAFGSKENVGKILQERQYDW